MKKLNNKGFGAIEVLLIVVIIGIIGGASYLVYNSQKKTNESLDNANNSLTSASQSNKTTDDATKQNSDNKSEDEISEDIVVCSVNPNAESGGGLKVAFNGYVKNDIYTKVWVKYGPSTTDMGLKTQEFPNGIDNCAGSLAHMPVAELKPGKYFYKVAASTHDGTVVYSEISNFTIE